MQKSKKPLRVLYSFPLKIGAARICTTAWHQVEGLHAAGAKVTVFPASISRSFPTSVSVSPTLSLGKLRLPHRLLSRLAYADLHDRIVARRLEKMADQIDIVHTWPIGSLRTLQTAQRLGIPTVLERCNAHTRFAYEVVQKECDRLGVPLPRGHEHAYDAKLLQKEEAEYDLAYRLLCPSDFVVKTFVEQNIPREKLVRHIYGFDETLFYPDTQPIEPKRGLTMISVGVCAVRKGLHYALEAWLSSPAHHDGQFLIAGDFVKAYAEKLAPLLKHPSIKILGHRNDIPDLMRKSDILVLPSIEEGFGLVCTEAMASGCVPIVSEACTDLCKHMDNALIHPVGGASALSQHITLLHEDRRLLQKLRTAGLLLAPNITWHAAGVTLLKLYEEIVSNSTLSKTPPTRHADSSC